MIEVGMWVTKEGYLPSGIYDYAKKFKNEKNNKELNAVEPGEKIDHWSRVGLGWTRTRKK